MRTLLMLAPLLASSAVALAQNPSTRIGVFAGMNQSQISGTATDISNHKGAAIGAYVAAPIAEGLRLQVGAEWTQKGWERDEPGTHDLAVVKLTYVEVPVLLRYDFTPRERAGVVVFAGPGLGFRSGCSVEETTHSTGQTQTATCAEIASASNGAFTFSSFDLGAITGAGARLAVASVQLLVTAQYEIGFKHVSSSGGNANRALTFGLGVELPIGRK
jgi:hypothetical protein